MAHFKRVDKALVAAYDEERLMQVIYRWQRWERIRKIWEIGVVALYMIGLAFLLYKVYVTCQP